MFNYLRPEKAVSDLSIIKPGMKLWTTYIDPSINPSFNIRPMTIVSEPYKYQDTVNLGYASENDRVVYEEKCSLIDSLWVQVNYGNYIVSESLNDLSVTANYNDHYLFLSKEDAQEAIDNRQENPDLFKDSFWSNFDDLTIYDYGDEFLVGGEYDD